MTSVLNKAWAATRGSASGVFAIWDEDGNQIAIITDTQQPDAVSMTIAAAPELVEACQIVYDWLRNDNNATSAEVFAEVKRALQSARPWDHTVCGNGPYWA